MQLVKSVVLGAKRHPKKLLAEGFLAYSALWTLVESVSAFFSGARLQGGGYYGGLVLLSVLIAVGRAYQVRSIEFKVAHTNTTIRVLFGDIFEREGHVAVPVNEYFDSELGMHVSPKSLHGTVISRFFGGHPAAFDQLVAQDLAGVHADQIDRDRGRTARFEIGTTASIATSTHKFLLFVLCKTDLLTLKATATLPGLVAAWQGLCGKARVVLNGERLVVPLAGSGLAGVGLAPRHLLQLSLIVLVDESKKNHIANEIEVVLHKSCFDEIDLGQVHGYWRHQ